MWRSNKTAIICLLSGLAALGVAFCIVDGQNPLLARQILSAGICILLFATALGSWLSVRADVRKRK